jgi:cytoskeletal protein CcmA (bactofilin family)
MVRSWRPVARDPEQRPRTPIPGPIATGEVDLRKGCRVEGDINASSVAATAGRLFEGRIAMPREPEPEVVDDEEKRRGSTDGDVQSTGNRSL